MKKGRYREKRKRSAAVLLLAFLTAGAYISVSAVENTKSGQVRSVHVSDSEIEDSTMIIGSHLIHINGLTDELYEVAVQSAGEFSQYHIYYKSELAGGSWFDVSEASSVLDITSEGTPVNKSVIEGLEFTHRTDAGGVTTDLRTKTAVNVYDINDPYDLEGLEELEPLRLQYEQLQEKTSPTDTDEVYIAMLRQFFQKSIRNSRTDQCDGELKSMQAYMESLAEREKPASWTDAADTVMGQIDAERRVESLTILSGFLDQLLDDAGGLTQSETEEEGQDTEKEEFEINSDVVAAVGESKKNVEDSILAYTPEIRDEGSNVAGRSRYRYSGELTDYAGKGEVSGCDAAVEKLCGLDNVMSGRVADQDMELELLRSDLIDAAGRAYRERLSAGTGGKYRQAVSDGAAETVRIRYLKDRKTETDAARIEYETMLEAGFIRMENKAAQEYALNLIEGVSDLEAVIPDDEAAPWQMETTASHLAWLQGQLAELIKNDTDSSGMDVLKKEREELAKRRQDALDNNDLAEERRLAAEEAAKEQDIDRLTRELTAVLGSENSSRSDKAKALAALGEGSAASLINTLADKITLAVREGDSGTDDMMHSVAALKAAGTLDPDAANAAVGRVRDALENAASPDAAAARFLSDEMDDLEAQIGVGGQAGFLSRDELAALLEQILGGSLMSSSETDQAASVAALERFGIDRPNQEARKLAVSYAERLAQQNNPYIYEKYAGEMETCLPLPTLGNIGDCRYIFNESQSRATLKKGRSYYTFTVSENVYEMTGHSRGRLRQPVRKMGTLYISAADAKEIFDIDGLYIWNSDYGAALTEEIEKRAQEIYGLLMDGGV